MPKCPTCGGHVDWIEIENERLGTSCRVADDCPRCMPHWIELPDPAPHPTSPSPDPVVVRLEREVRVLQVGLAELGNRLLTLSCDPPRGYRLANQDSEWCLFDHRGECVEYGDTLEELVRKLGGDT